VKPARTASPHIPALWPPLRAYNAVAPRLPWIDVRMPSRAELVAEAVRGVPGAVPADLADDGWTAGLDAFLVALVTEADLTPAGVRFAHGVIRSGLVNRLHVQRALAADDAIAARPVGPAVVVVGLPRSGTTLLQHLLSLDPDSRSLRQWEAATPGPPPGGDPDADRRRIRAAEHSARLLDRLAPQARTLHPTGPALPTECVTLFANSFASLELGVIYQVPSYVDWCLTTDMRPHYAFYARQLQVLARHERRERWSLKSPAHLFWLDELTRALPESRVVSLRRDPIEVLSSFCRLVMVMSAATARRVDPHEVGAYWSGVWVEGVRRATAARARIASDRWVDVEYRDLVADPVGTVSGIYGAFELPFGDGLARALRDHLAAHPRRISTIQYSLADFGLDAEEQRRRFDEASRLPAPLETPR
jgi:hypothetical protein